MYTLIDDEGGVSGLAREVLDGERDYPVVCLTSRRGQLDPALDPEEVRDAVGENAFLCVVPTGSLTYRLKELLPPMLDVYEGAARIWWPGVSGASAPADHPLVQDRYGVYGSKSMADLARAFRRGPPARQGGGSKDPRIGHLIEERDTAVARAKELAVRVAALEAEFAQVRQRAASAERALREERKRTQETPSERASGERPIEPEADLYLMIVSEWLKTGPSERTEHPLAPFSLGSEFLDSLAAVREIPESRVAHICSRVEAGTAHEYDGLQVHPLRAGPGGSDPQRVRGDGAEGWRCAIKRGAPSAPRLHYWVLPGGSVEFAKVVRHDDFSI